MSFCFFSGNVFGCPRLLNSILWDWRPSMEMYVTSCVRSGRVPVSCPDGNCLKSSSSQLTRQEVSCTFGGFLYFRLKVEQHFQSQGPLLTLFLLPRWKLWWPTTSFYCTFGCYSTEVSSVIVSRMMNPFVTLLSDFNWMSFVLVMILKSIETGAFSIGKEVACNADLMWCPRPGCDSVCSLVKETLNNNHNSSTSTVSTTNSTTETKRRKRHKLLPLIPARSERRTAVSVTCANCRFEFCSTCRSPWHRKSPCPNASASSVDPSNHQPVNVHPHFHTTY